MANMQTSQPLAKPLAQTQTGVALLLVLLLMVAITVVAGVMLARQQLAVRQADLLFGQNNMRHQLDFSQQLAAEIIRNDGELNDFDSIQDVWAQPIPPIVNNGYELGIQISDASAKFNLNNLYQNGEVNTQALQVFERLLTLLQLDSRLAIAVLDWQDTDTEVYLDGGNEAVIYAPTNSQTVANQPFSDIAQLTSIQGFDEQTIATLRPYISVMPMFVPINVNTASPLLLQAVFTTGTDDGNPSDSDNNAEVATQVSLPDFRQNPVATSDELWDLAEIKVLDDAVLNTAKRLCGVGSMGFDILVSVTDAKGRSRYRTLNAVRSNSNPSANQQNNGASGVGQNQGSASQSDADTQKVGLFNQREWAFAPTIVNPPAIVP